MRCRLCGAGADDLILSGIRYAECPGCGYLGIDPSRFPAPEAERARYLLHRNDPGEPGYRSWLESFAEFAILPYAPGGCTVLDFGSGPVPALREVLAEKGFATRTYDPFFAPDAGYADALWSAIALNEVAEHLRDPRSVFAGLASLLAPGGVIAVRTAFAPEGRTGLEGWWYRKDPTHVGFFRPRSFERLAQTLALECIFPSGKDMVTLRYPRGRRAAAGVVRSVAESAGVCPQA